MGPSVFMRGSCVFSGKNHSVLGIIVITPPSRLGGGVKMPMFDPQPGDTLEDRGGVRWTMRSGIDRVLASRYRMVGARCGARPQICRSTALKE